MAEFEQRELSGALFRNTFKKAPNQPDHRGSCKIGNEEYDISAWVKDGRGGSKFFSLAFQKKVPAGTAPTPSGDVDFSEDVPF